MHSVRYSEEFLKSLGIIITMTYDDYTFAPEILIETDDALMRYKTTMIDIIDNKSVDKAIQKFIVGLRKEKLEKLKNIH